MRIKYLGIFLLHVFKKRYFCVFLDTALMCNLRCKMCYFSDTDFLNTKNNRILSDNEIEKIANAFFHRALKLQIGCGAEPSVYKHNTRIIQLAKEKKVPYISMTTNANLFTNENWKDLLDAGLNEATISLHGVSREMYETMMPNAKYEKLLSSLDTLTRLKQNYPTFKIRLNYTINADNLLDLSNLFETFADYDFDILQIRPIQKIGNSAYNNFSWDFLIDHYGEVIEKVKNQAEKRHITVLFPTLEDLKITDRDKNENDSILDLTHFYISPNCCWQHNFDLQSDTYEIFSKKTHFGRQLFLKVFQQKSDNKKSAKHLNYSIQ